jgi:hypothetical protein
MNKGKFQSLQAKLAKCLVNWDPNPKSYTTKEVLIKSVAQALTVYVMEGFKLPMDLCNELTKMIGRYCCVCVRWVGGEEAESGKRKINTMSKEVQVLAGLTAKAPVKK